MKIYDTVEFTLRLLIVIVMMPSTIRFTAQCYTEGKFFGVGLFGILTMALGVFLYMTIKEMKQSKTK